VCAMGDSKVSKGAMTQVASSRRSCGGLCPSSGNFSGGGIKKPLTRRPMVFKYLSRFISRARDETN
jgi:hypothetical protein